MSRAQQGVAGLGQLARLALAQAEPQCAQGLRTYSSAGRYSPKQFSKEKPVDKSATWIAKNPYIESWVYRRDKLEREFSWDFRTTVETGYLIVGIAAGFAGFAAMTTRHTDRCNGYPERNYLGVPSRTGRLYMPDERDWN